MPIDPKELIRQIKADQELLEEIADEMEAAIFAALREAEKKLWPSVEQLMQDAPVFYDMTERERLAWWGQNRGDLDDIMVASGYGAAVNGYMRKMPAIAEASARLMVTGGATGFEGFRSELLAEFSRQVRSRFTFLGTEAHRRLEAVFFDAVITGRIKSAALGDIRGTITGSYPWGNRRGLYRWHAGTYARTAHFQTSRKLMAAQARQEGLTQRLYVGPLDSKTREFCQQLVGQTFTVSEIEQMDNGQTGPVITDGGGWNCRHQWAPVSGQVANALAGEQQVELLRAA